MQSNRRKSRETQELNFQTEKFKQSLSSEVEFKQNLTFTKAKLEQQLK